MKRALSILIVFVAEFALFEAALRLHAGSEAAPEFQALFAQDDRIGHVLKPGATARFSTVEFTTDIRINNAGVRDDDFGPKPPGEKRIVILGDSLVMAVQVPQSATFVKRLEARLNERRAGGTHYRVINAGIQGYGPVEELLFFEKTASRFQPDLVIVGVYVCVGVNVGTAIVAGRPTTRATRNCSTIPSRRAVMCRCDHQTLRIGVISGWSWSTVTETRSPGPPGCSVGVHVAETWLFASDGVYTTPGEEEQTVIFKYPGVSSVVTAGSTHSPAAPERVAS